MKTIKLNSSDKPIFNLKKSKNEDEEVKNKKEQKYVSMDEENDNEGEEDDERPSMLDMMGSAGMLKKVVIALSVIIIVICVGFIIYQFYTKRNQQRIDICTQDRICEYERRINELEEQSNEVIADNTKMAQQFSALQNEYNNYIQHVEQQRKEEYNKKPQVIYKTTNKKKPAKIHHEEESEDVDDEYAVDIKQFDDAPIKSKNKKKVNPQQALKNRINEQAKKAYDKKQTAIQQQMDNEDDDDGEQQEIQQQLGLSRNINEKKLMALADEQEQQQEQQEQHNTQDGPHIDNNDEGVGLNDEVVEIDPTLIA